jgi:hypothetical protein
MHKLAVFGKPLKALPKPGMPAPAPRVASRTRPGTTPMRKEGPLNDPTSLEQAIMQTPLHDPPPPPLVPPPDQWPQEAPLADRVRANPRVARAMDAFRRS